MEVQLVPATSVIAATIPCKDELRRTVTSKPDDSSRAVFDFNKLALAAAMRQVGLSSVTVTYCGGGDEGRTDDISFVPHDLNEGATMAVVALMRYRWDPEQQCGAGELVFKDMALPDIAEALCDAAISLTDHSGYEDGDGGSGTLTLQAFDASCELVHSDYYTESHTSTHSL